MADYRRLPDRSEALRFPSRMADIRAKGRERLDETSSSGSAAANLIAHTPFSVNRDPCPVIRDFDFHGSRVAGH